LNACYNPSNIKYVGIDKNPHMLEIARSKNFGKNKLFLRLDIREVTGRSFDLVTSFGVLKHFSLEEWPDILKKMLSFGKFGLFTQHALLRNRYP